MLNTHLETFSSFAFLTSLLDLGAARLLFELSLANTTVVFESEEDIKHG